MDLENLKIKAVDEVKNAESSKILEELRIKYLGRKGELSSILRTIKDLPISERRSIGPQANQIRQEIETLFVKRQKELANVSLLKKIDITKPGKKIERGHPHPLAKIEEQIRHIFLAMNFSVVEGSEIETEYYNFDALNVPANHPARDMWDTFWLKTRTDADSTRTYAERMQTDTDQNADKRGKIIRINQHNNQHNNQHKSASLLRTHTSPMQVRYMETHKPPFQIIVPGRVFRYEATDASHEVNFYQVEGLMVGENISLANFKYVVSEFFKQLFKQPIKFRFRPSYFPFTEPSVEVDILFNKSADKRRQNADKRGNSLRSSASSQRESASWMEVMGAGMVHPNVFKAVGYEPRKIQGFAFGVGLDRLAMLKYKIPDIRMFYSGDLRIVRQF